MFEENCGDSILKIGLAALAYLRQYNEIFKLLLEQGLGGTGIIYNDYPVILSKYLTAISEEQELNYVVDLLVKYNICLENSNQVVHSEKDIKALLSKKRFYKIKQTLTSCGCYSVTTKSKTKETASTAAAGFIDSKQLALDWLKPFDSCLEVICCMHHINVTAITHLAEHSSLESIVKSLSILCNNPGINTRLISSTSFTMSLKEEKIVDSTTLAPSLPNLMINPQLTANPPIIFENNCYEWILYPNQSTSDSINISTVICNLIRLLHQKIASNQHNIFTKDGLYEKLATKAMTLKGEISAFYARSCLCLLLLASSYSSMSNQQTSKKLMQMFGIIGNACFVEERFYMAANNYTNACIIGYYSLLTNTPSFTRCKQYLEASAKKPVEACKNFLLFSRVLSERVATVQNPVSTNASTSSFANKKQGCYCKS